MFPTSIASQITGLPGKAPMSSGMSAGKPPKKPARRGRKPSGKPGASHLAALQQAHGAGNFAQAKTHALNYAKAVHTALSSPAEPDADEMGGVSDGDTDTAPMNATVNPRAMLAKLAMRRRPSPL